jgi:ABC-type uncharacterized transport system involved in gliding motility auxiliary subunit
MLAVVLINVAGLTLFFRLDLTQNRVYSISKVSKDVVSTLTEPLTINVFFTKNLPAPYNNIERYLHDLLEEYAIYGNRFFNYRFYNVSPDTEGINPSAKGNQKIAENYGIHPLQVQAIEKDEVKFKKAYMGLVVIHGDMVEKISTITSINGMEYKLTTAIQKLNNKISAMLNLQGKIQIKFYMSSAMNQVAPYMGLKALPDYPDRLKEIVASENDRMYGKLEYSYIDPASEAEKRASSKNYKLMQLKWPAIDNGKVPAGSGVIGLVMEYDKKVRKIPILKVLRVPLFGTKYDLMGLDQMKEVINKNLETLVDINEDLGYLADHGTLNIFGSSPFNQQRPNSLKNFSSLISRNYTLKQVNLKDGTIPTSLNSLVVARPTEKFTDYELYLLDQALMRGTNLILFIDAFKEARNPRQNMGFNQGPMLEPFDSGLEKLLEHYGVRIKKSIVLDENSHKQQMARSIGGGEMPVYFAPIIKNENINHDLPFMKEIKGLVALKVSPLELNDKQLSENNITAHKVFSSSSKSWEMRDNIMLNPMFMRPPSTKDEQESMTLAYLLEGKFRSYFDGKPIPEKTAEKEKPGNKSQLQDKKAGSSESEAKKPDPNIHKIERSGGFIAKGADSKIFLLASADMLKNNILNPEAESPNDMFVMNIIDAMNKREDIAAMRSKVQRFNPLSEFGSTVKAFIKIFNVAGLPILVVSFGLFIMLRRHSRKKQIQMIFQK